MFKGGLKYTREVEKGIKDKPVCRHIIEHHDGRIKMKMMLSEHSYCSMQFVVDQIVERITTSSIALDNAR